MRSRRGQRLLILLFELSPSLGTAQVAGQSRRDNISAGILTRDPGA
jgi:hypothetical protein